MEQGTLRISQKCQRNCPCVLKCVPQLVRKFKSREKLKLVTLEGWQYINSFMTSKPPWLIYGIIAIKITSIKKSWSLIKALDSLSRGPVFKTTRWLLGQLSLLSFHDQSNEYQEFLGLSGKGKVSPCSGSVALRQLNLIHKKGQ